MTDEQQQTNLDLEEQFLFYLKKVNLNPDIIPRVQYIETKRAFYAGWAQFLNIIMLGFAIKPDGWAEEALTAIENQVRNFWRIEGEKHQVKRN